MSHGLRAFSSPRSTPRSVSDEAAMVEAADLVFEVGDGAADGHGGGDLLDGERGNGAGRDAPGAQPLAELRGGRDVDDVPEPDPGVGGGAHGAVLAGGVDGGGGALLGGEMSRGPAGELELRVAGAVGGGRAAAGLREDRAA